MKNKHTPGPWKATTCSDNGFSVKGPDGKSVAAYASSGRRDRGEQWANARLIAAAPELLELTKALLDLANGDDPPITAGEVGRICNRAADTIRKAEEGGRR